MYVYENYVSTFVWYAYVQYACVQVFSGSAPILKLVNGYHAVDSKVTYTSHLTAGPDLGSVEGQDPRDESEDKTLFAY